MWLIKTVAPTYFNCLKLNSLSMHTLAAISKLTKQEYWVMSSLQQGLSVKAIAQNMEISVHTVNGHMKSIFFKLDVKSRSEAQYVFNQYLSITANKELVFQSSEKAKRAAELLIANIELAFQTEEKAKRADELVLANIEKAKQSVHPIIDI